MTEAAVMSRAARRVPIQRRRAEDLLARGKYVYAVRRVRELTGLRLLDARRLVDSLQR